MRIRTKQEFLPLFSLKAVLFMAAAVVFLITLSAVLQNISLFSAVFFDRWSFETRLVVFAGMMLSVFTNNSLPALAVLILTGILAGSHIALAQKKSIACSPLGMACAGCSACGLSVLSLIGIAGVASLPLGGLELGIIGVLVLGLLLVVKV